ncbi:MAG TPA: hypothetical protein VLJ58_00325, partial [Ramlibacter sp.]|nr:hypothetical protein [Ramlibacter sp.]
MMMADNSTHLSPRGPEDLGGDRRFHVVEFAGNRAQRRQAARADRRKSTRPAKPEGIVDTTELAIHRATRLTDAERNRMLHPAREGFTALRRGVATHEQWAAVAGAVNVALAIETQGVV